jgi:hypothetical protein
MTDTTPPPKKRENPDVANKPARTVKFAKLTSPASVLDIPGPVENRAWLHTYLTHQHLLEMSEEDKMSLYISWRRLQFIACTEPKGRVLKNVHLMAMDVGMLEHLFSDWNDLKHRRNLRHRNLQEANERNHRRLEAHRNLQEADERYHMDLQELDEIREAEELEYHENIASEMEYVDHDEYNLDSSD